MVGTKKISLTLEKLKQNKTVLPNIWEDKNWVKAAHLVAKTPGSVERAWPLESKQNVTSGKLLNLFHRVTVDRLPSLTSPDTTQIHPSPPIHWKRGSAATFTARGNVLANKQRAPVNTSGSIFFKGPWQGPINLPSGTLSNITRVSLLSWTILISTEMIHNVF